MNTFFNSFWWNFFLSLKKMPSNTITPVTACIRYSWYAFDWWRIIAVASFVFVWSCVLCVLCVGILSGLVHVANFFLLSFNLILINIPFIFFVSSSNPHPLTHFYWKLQNVVRGEYRLNFSCWMNKKIYSKKMLSEMFYPHAFQK